MRTRWLASWMPWPVWVMFAMLLGLRLFGYSVEWLTILIPLWLPVMAWAIWRLINRESKESP